MLVVRPAVAVVATARSSLTRNERIFIGAMDPRGIVAASTAASFSAPLVALHIGGADKLLPATFLVIVGTVAIYGLAAAPLARKLGLREPEPETGTRQDPCGTTPLSPPGETGGDQTGRAVTAATRRASGRLGGSRAGPGREASCTPTHATI